MAVTDGCGGPLSLAIGLGGSLPIIEEGTSLAFAAAAYQPTVEGVISMLREMGVQEPDPDLMLRAQLAPLPLLQPHFIIRDPSRKALVVYPRHSHNV